MTVLQTLHTISPVFLPVHKISVSSQRPQKLSLFAPTCHQLFKCVRLTVKTSYCLHLCDAYQTGRSHLGVTLMNIVHQRETACFWCAETVSLSKVWQAFLLLSLWLFSHGYRGNAWQFEREVIRVISSNGSLHKYRIQIKANWTPACANKELNCLRVSGTGTTLFASAVLLFSALSLPPPSSSSSHSYCWCSDSMETRPSPLPKGFPDCAANVHICRWSLGGLPKKCLPASL